MRLVARFFTDKLKGSNSMDEELLVVNRQTERRLDEVRSDQDIVKVKWSGKNRVAYWGGG
jgi:hypothetical protein